VWHRKDFVISPDYFAHSAKFSVGRAGESESSGRGEA